MKTKHTPGPWAVIREDLETGEIALHITHKLTKVCVVYSYDREDKKRNERADARLIAAAPDLLAACEGAVNKCPRGCTPGWYCGICGILFSAIAKAKGETR